MKKQTFIFILIILGFIVYANSLFNGFLWDDEEFILNNPEIRSLTNIPKFFLPNPSSYYYRPVSSTSLTIFYSFFGPQPFFFRLFQVTIHILNTLLVFYIFKRLFSGKNLLAFLVSAIFLVHPINSEAVDYISAIGDLLFFFFGSLGLLIVVNDNKDTIDNILTCCFLLFLSLLSKETGFAFFIILLVFAFLFKRKNAWKYFIASLGFVFFYIFLRSAVGLNFVKEKGLFPIMRASFYERLQTIPEIIFYYLKVFFFPKDLAVAVHFVVKTPNLQNFLIPLMLESSIFLIIIIFLFKKKDKLSFFFFTWFLIGLGLHLQIFPLNMTFAERWFYLPIVGLLGLIASILAKYKLRITKKITLLILVLIVVLSVRTIIRNFDWRNGLILFSHDIKISKHTFDIENNLGTELFRIGKIDEAKIYYEKSVQEAPYWWVNWNNLGAVYQREGNLSKAEEYYKKSIANGDYYLAYENYAAVLIKLGKYTEAKEFMEKNALVKFPNDQSLNFMNFYLLQNNK